MTEHGATPEEVTQAQSDRQRSGNRSTTAGYRACEEMGAIDEHSSDNGHGVWRRCRSGSNGRGCWRCCECQYATHGEWRQTLQLHRCTTCYRTGALSQGKGPLLTGGVSVGGAYVGSTIKGEDPTNAMIGAGVGSAIGSGASKITENVSSEIGGAVVGSITSEVVGGKVTDQLDARKKPMKINKTGLINLFLLCVYWFWSFLTVF